MSGKGRGKYILQNLETKFTVVKLSHLTMLLPTIPQEDWRWAVTPIDSGTNEICVKQGEKGALEGFGSCKATRVASLPRRR